MLSCNANHGGAFATAQESDEILADAHRAGADLLGTTDPDCVFFGANMTSLTFALSRALAASWKAGDEIIVSDLDHDANVTPWQLAAREAGVTVHRIGIDAATATLRMDQLSRLLSQRTRLVAVGYAANATGTINPIREVTRAAHNAGALVFVDAVHFAPHGLIDVQQLDCDFLAASAYKFFGPHVGIMYGKRDLLEQLRPYKLRPAPDNLPGRWMTGTQNHEGIAGVSAAVTYLDSLGTRVSGDDAASQGRRERLAAAFAAIREYEQQLSEQMTEGLQRIPGARIIGIQDPAQFKGRVPTFSVTVDGHRPADLSRKLADDGIFTWAGNHYALPFTEAAGLEPHGTLRAGALHYNTPAEIDRFTSALARHAAT